MSSRAIRNRLPWSTAGVLPLILIGLLAGSVHGGDITGNCRVEKVWGHPGSYVDLYEWNIWPSKQGGGSAMPHFRVGLPPNPQSYYEFLGLSSGSYSLFLDQPLFWGRPTVVSYVSVPTTGSVYQEVSIPSDYGCAFGGNSGIWGANPWTAWQSVWYQTFIATGTGITGINFKLAGRNCEDMRVSIHEDNGGNITTWPQVGISRVRNDVGSTADQWLRFRSGEIPTASGTRYALKLTGLNGSPNNEFSVYRRIDGGTGYANGQAYDVNGNAQNFDLYANVFSDSDGTVVPYCSVVYDGGNLAGWAGVWSQEIRAVGTSLGGAGLYYAGGDTWQIQVTFRVRSGSASGPQVGPEKTSWGGYQAAQSGMVGASWNPGEVPLTPGQIYYLEVDAGSHGFNPSKFSRSENVYPDGHAYQSFGAQPDVDLHMQVVEYAGQVDPPSIWKSPSSFSHTIERGETIADDTLSVRNSGGGSMSYTITENATWLTVDPSQGTSYGETDSITVAYSAEELAIGEYDATITMTAPGADNSPQTVPVHVSVLVPEFAPCDFDEDNDVDQADYGAFQACYSGTGAPHQGGVCDGADLDNDYDVDADDYTKFTICATGPNGTADPLCAD